MENASKALLIAGAILICILLIAIGMYIYNSAQGTIKTAASQMGQQEKEMYNATVKKYIGDSKKGSEVKLMIEDIITNNNQNVNESGKFISVHNGKKGTKNANRGGYDTDISKTVAAYTGDLDDLCYAANVYEDHSNGNNDQGNIDAATDEMREFAKKISSGKNYLVKEAEEDGIIYAVFVSPIN